MKAIPYQGLIRQWLAEEIRKEPHLARIVLARSSGAVRAN